MSRPAVRIVLFLLIGLLLASLLGALANWLDPPQSTYGRQVRQLLARADQVTLLVAGNSHGSSVDLPSLPAAGEGFHLWRLGEDAFETDFVLRTLLPRLPHVDTVIVPLSYYHFNWDKAALWSAGSDRREVYGGLPTWRFLPGDLREFIWGKVQALPALGGLLRTDNWEDVFWSAVRLVQGTPPPVRGDFLAENLPDGFLECRARSAEDLAEAVVSREVPQHFGWQVEMSANHPGIEADVEAATRSLIEYLQAQGVRPVFYTTPYFETYTAAYDPATVARTRETMKRLAAEYGVEYYDFSTDPEFAGHAELFSDGNHLNLCGARLFSQRLGELMAEHGP